MYTQNLFSRLKDIVENPNNRLNSQNISVEVDSIKKNIYRLLSAKEGCSELNIKFGLSDISYMGNEYFNDFLNSLETEISYKIKEFEPRLKNIEIKFIKKENNSFNLKFLISGTIKKDNSSEIEFKTIIYPQGRIQIYD